MNGFLLAVGQWFASIPAVVWSGVIGATIAAGISYVGVRSANKGSLQRLREQHDYDRAQANEQRQHDARQKEEDRKAAIRREVYLKTVEEAHAVLAYIGALPDRPLPMKDEDAALQAFLKANAKVWLVADVEGAALSRELTNLMSELYLAAMQAAIPVRHGMTFVRRQDERIEFARGRLKALDAQLADAHGQAVSTETINALVNDWNAANERIADLEDHRQKLFESLFPERRAAFDAIAGKMELVQTMMVRLVCALREELHLDRNDQQFMAILDDMKARALRTLDMAFDRTATDA